MQREYCVGDGRFHEGGVANCHDNCPIFAYCEAGRELEARGGDVMAKWRWRDLAAFFAGLNRRQARFVVGAFSRHISEIPNAVRNIANKQAVMNS